MKTFILFFLYSLITEGVFGESVSVKEGDSVTLHTGLSEIQTNDVIDWRFGGQRIARMKKGSEPSKTDDALDGKFRGRLKLDGQTGDLTITNFRNTDSGEYKVSNSTDTLNVLFTVTVVSAAAVESVLGLEGYPVTLPTDLTEIQTDYVIQWRFGKQKSPVAEINRKAGIVNTVVTDERFRDRLNLDHQSGSLIINNTRITDSGDYEVEISRSRSRHTIHHTQSFSLTVRDYVESVLVLEGDNVPLHTGLTGTERIEQIRWTFGDDEVIADLNGPVNKDNFGLNNQTGDLTIRNIQKDQSGDYKVEINTRTMRFHKKYKITVFDYVKPVSVLEGDNVPLHTGLTGTERIEQIRWTFGDDEVIADLNGPVNKDNFGLNNQNGELTIRNIQKDQSGDYEVEINTRTMRFHRKYKITVVALPDSGLSPAAVAGIVVVGLLAAAAGVIYYCCKRSKMNRPNRALNGTQDTSYRVNEVTELTNAS